MAVAVRDVVPVLILHVVVAGQQAVCQELHPVDPGVQHPDPHALAQGALLKSTFRADKPQIPLAVPEVG